MFDFVVQKVLSGGNMETSLEEAHVGVWGGAMRTFSRQSRDSGS